MRRLTRSSFAALAVAICTPATGADTGGDVADVVVVTATRRAQPDADIPAAISVIDGEALRHAQPRVNLSEALVAVPGVQALDRRNHAQDLQISTRGFGARASFGVRGLRLVVDGIPASMPDGQGQIAHVDLESAARVEVMRGPFSVLHGNAAGGVIAVDTAPGRSPATAGASFGAGSDGFSREALSVGGRIGEALDLRAGASQLRSEGYRDHAAAQRRQANARLGWTQGETRVVVVANRFDLPHAQDPLGLTQAQWRADPRQAGSNALAYDTRKTVAQAQAGLTVERNDSGGGTAHVALWQGHRDVAQFQSIPRAAQAAPGHGGGVIDLARKFDGIDARWTQRVGDWLTATVGVAAEHQDDARRGFENFAGTTLGVRGALRRDEDNRFAGRDVYAQFEWHPLADWRVHAGARRSRLDVRSTDHFTATGNPDDSGALRFARTTPAIGASWLVAPGLSLYGAAGEGFETPTGNELAYRPDGSSGLNFALRPATSRHVEAGMKWRRADARLDLAIFRVDTADEIVVAASSGGRTTFRNGGDTARRGAELGARALWPLAGGRLEGTLAATWLDARFADGRRLPGIAARSAFAALEWQGAWAGAQPFVGVEWRALSHMVASDANTGQAPGYALANLRAGMRRELGGWSVEGFARVDNAFDRAYVGSLIVNEAQGRYYEPAPGRQWLVGLDVRRRFD